jgi:hypothetical protein
VTQADRFVRIYHLRAVARGPKNRVSSAEVINPGVKNHAIPELVALTVERLSIASRGMIGRLRNFVWALFPSHSAFRELEWIFTSFLQESHGDTVIYKGFTRELVPYPYLVTPNGSYCVPRPERCAKCMSTVGNPVRLDSLKNAMIAHLVYLVRKGGFAALRYRQIMMYFVPRTLLMQPIQPSTNHRLS